MLRKSSLGRLFNDLVNRSFDDLNLVDAGIRAYVIELLVGFARTDALYRIEDPGGKRLDTVVDLLIETGRIAGGEGHGTVERELDVTRHTGDYALFMSGIFRNYVERNGFLDWHLRQGERAYRRAAELSRKLMLTGVARFEMMAADFERLSGALDYMKKVYFGRAVRQFKMTDLGHRFDTWN